MATKSAAENAPLPELDEYSDSEDFVIIDEDPDVWTMDSFILEESVGGKDSPEEQTSISKENSVWNSDTPNDDSIPRDALPPFERSDTWSHAPSVERSEHRKRPDLNFGGDETPNPFKKPQSDLRFCNACDYALRGSDSAPVLHLGYWYHESCFRARDAIRRESRHDCEENNTRRVKSKRLHTRIRRFFKRIVRN